MERLREILALLGDDDQRAALTIEQLEATRAELLGLLAQLRDREITPEPGDEMTDIEAAHAVADAVRAVTAEHQARTEADAERASAFDEIVGELGDVVAEDTPVEPETPPEEDDENDDEKPAEGDKPAEATDPGGAPGDEHTPPSADDDEKVPAEAVAAAVQPSLAGLARRVPRQHQPEERPSPATTRPRILTMEPTPMEITDKAGIAAEIIRRRETLVSVAPGFEDKLPIVRIQADYPENRLVSADVSADNNTHKLQAVTAGAADPRTYDDPEVQARVASGGFCAPAEPRYDVGTVVTEMRPVRDFLPRVGATRGRIEVVRRPSISEVVTGGPTTAGAAVGLWTNTTDTTPGENIKTRQRFACRTIQTCETYAVYEQLIIGNFHARAFPEDIAASLDLVGAAHARLGEQELLDCMIDAAKENTEVAVLGTMRDLLEQAVRLAENLRSKERMDPNTRLRVVYPEWAFAEMVADIVRQQASGELDALAVTKQQIRAIFASHNLNVGTYIDSATGDGQIWGQIGDGVNLRNWPTTVVWGMYPEGAYVFLDGGTLDLGIVRDSTLNQTNDYTIFSETFEGCCYLGPDAVWVTSTVCPNGESQVATDETGGVCTGS